MVDYLNNEAKFLLYAIANKIQPLNMLYDLINILYKTWGHICFNFASNDVSICS